MPPSHTQYALYLQATRLRRTTGKVQRRQWIVLPPLTEALAATLPGTSVKPSPNFLMFSREQMSPENRVKWRATYPETSLLERDLPERLEKLLRENDNLPGRHQWVISPAITAQVTVRELADLHGVPETPYALLRRFEKVAKSRHHIAI